mmetsp:Transcript_42942/g.50372  ORF Transcript_42942/g.50372 Transcript_42942/m.50372 type:complete len:245 (+) Transcript_42942:694-1428(+)
MHDLFVSTIESSKSTMFSTFAPMPSAMRAKNDLRCFFSMEYLDSVSVAFFSSPVSSRSMRESMIEVAITGLRCSSLLIFNDSLSSMPCKCGQRLGILRIGSGWCQNLSSSLPVSSFKTMTLPAKVRSLSSHVCQRAPPYHWIATSLYPCVSISEMGATLTVGESVWHPTILKQSGGADPAVQLSPTWNAQIVVLFRVKKYFCPPTSVHLSGSLISMKSLSLRSFFTVSTEWKGDTAVLSPSTIF